MTEIRGKAFVLGDNIDTDQIYPSRYLEEINSIEMAKHALAGISPDLASSLRSFGVVVAGRNFGCGSSREHATRCLKEAGINCILALSFARIFYRNAINIGLPVLCLPPTHKIVHGDTLVVLPFEGAVHDVTRGDEYPVSRISGLAGDILRAGGLVRFHLGSRS